VNQACSADYCPWHKTTIYSKIDQGTAYPSVATANSGALRFFQGHISEILIAFAAMTLPMITFTAILLGLVQNDFVSDTLAFGTEQVRNDANYVRISATALITVASWSSTIARILAGIAATLVSYPLAKHLLTASEIHGTSQLPTPFQLCLVIRMISSESFSVL
jgi:hypothetical protein